MPYLFLDLETTGLEPDKDEILEVAYLGVSRVRFDYVQLDESGEDDLDRAIQSHVVKPSPAGWDRLSANAYVNAMHKQTELLYKLNHGIDVQEAEIAILEYMGKIEEAGEIDTDKDRWELAGNGVHFDLLFIKQHMPTLAEHLHYRVFNVSTLFEFFEGRLINPVKNDLAHSAAGDVKYSFDSTTFYLDAVEAAAHSHMAMHVARKSLGLS